MTGVVSPNMEETLSRLASIDGLEFNVHINRSSRLAGRLAFLKQPLEKARDLNLQPSILSTLAQIVAESEKFLKRFVDIQSWDESTSKEDTVQFRNINSSLIKILKEDPLFETNMDLSRAAEEDRDDRIEDREIVQAANLEKRKGDGGGEGSQRGQGGDENKRAVAELEGAPWGREALQSDWSMEGIEESVGKAVATVELHGLLREGEARERVLRQRLLESESREQDLRSDLKKAMALGGDASSLRAQLRECRAREAELLKSSADSINESRSAEDELRSSNLALASRLAEADMQREQVENELLMLKKIKEEQDEMLDVMARELREEKDLRVLNEKLLAATIQSRNTLEWQLNERNHPEGSFPGGMGSTGSRTIEESSAPMTPKRSRRRAEWSWVERSLSNPAQSLKSGSSVNGSLQDDNHMKLDLRGSFESTTNSGRMQLQLDGDRLIQSQLMRENIRLEQELQRRQSALSQSSTTMEDLNSAHHASTRTNKEIFSPANFEGTITKLDISSSNGGSQYQYKESPFGGNRACLKAISDSCRSSRWIRKNGWSPQALDERHGLSWNPSKTKVKLLELGSNGLSGSLPKELGGLTSLLCLRLNHNEITGCIPAEIGLLSQLQQLELQGNDFTGAIPKQLGNLPDLEYLGLHENKLAGPIPKEFGNLVKLRHMALCSNRLSGEIPSEIGMLRQLEKLYLNNNRFTGTLPDTMGRMVSLVKLRLEGNSIKGSIPPEVGDILKLEILNLGFAGNGNNFSGEIPVKALGKLTSLVWLSISDNPDLHVKKGPFGGSKANLKKVLPSSCEVHL